MSKLLTGPLRRGFGAARRALAADGGTSVVEFGLISPLFCLILVGTIDFGGELYVKFNLTGTVSAAANYALINAGNVSSSGGASLAYNLAYLAANNHAANWSNASVVVNNGPSETATGGTMSAGGTASNADSCYCPTLSGSTVTWGSALSCGITCPAGGVAGKFVTVLAQKTYTPMFPSYGLVTSRTISARTMVETN